MHSNSEKSPLRIGITGGIGSGKTTVCKIFEALGIPVYYADAAAKRLMVEDSNLRYQLQKLFGSEVYHENGELNRAYLSQMVFTNEQKLKQLNALVHPAVEIDACAWHSRQRNVAYTLKEAALIFESGSYRNLDRVINVYAPLEIRIERVMKRDNLTRQQVLDRIQHQWPEEDKIALSDHIIVNDNTLSLNRQVQQLHLRLSSLT